MSSGSKPRTTSFFNSLANVQYALALVKPAGFDKEEKGGEIIYTTEIVYHRDKENLLLRYEKLKELNKNDLGFHYSPYNFDSNPEVGLFLRTIDILNEDLDDVEDVYFTGAISDPAKPS